ncbi:GlyGly-CTERM sorting domain-containing protein [Photobacterium leiognathi]|uniref:GlyGly-CTERM sorting domain-containing protein n=1 Tax=Photobacterium leiognathi TaxID=553611 RepID=UPI0027381DD2|nr:trypsin-like serine protease [Photobacterium leiognathi]
MKKITILALSIANFFAASSTFAIVGGVNVNESEYPQFLQDGGCSGTIVAGKYILTAAHCDKSSDTFIVHPNYQINLGYDIALAKLTAAHPVNTVSFLSSIAENNEDELIHMYGWSTGGLKRADLLTRSPDATIPIPLYLKFNGNGHAEPGDSGAPILFNDKIISVLSGIDVGSGEDNGAITSRIEYSRDFILSTINDWHSPTELKFTGNKTIEIQSLHVNNTNLALRQNNGSLSSGDVTVTGGSCITDGDVAPFGICTLEMKSGPYEGKVVLDDGNEITINRGKKPTPPNPDPDGKGKGGGGGSLGWLTLLGLLGCALRRRD